MSLDVLLGIWAGLGLAAVLVEVLARCRHSPTIGALLTAGLRLPVGRAVLLAGWLWVGWHFFGR